MPGEHPSQLRPTRSPTARFTSIPCRPETTLCLADRDGFVSNQPDSKSRLHHAPSRTSSLPDVTVQMTPQGSITGKVVDEDGKPIAGAQVRALIQKQKAQLATATADASGNFKLPKLAPGDYYVLADPPEKAQGDFVRTIYPHSLNFDDAAQYPGRSRTNSLGYRASGCASPPLITSEEKFPNHRRALSSKVQNHNHASRLRGCG